MSAVLRHSLELALFAAVYAVARPLPRAAAARLGARLGRLVGACDRRHTRVALDNLRLAFGDDLAPERRRQIVRACWEHFGTVTLDWLCLAKLGEEKLRRWVLYEGLEHIRAAYARGRGVLLFSGHFGHWELVALMQGYLAMPLTLVVRPLDNPWLDRWLTRMRSRSGNRVVAHRGAAREMLAALRRAGGVAIVIDQDARDQGVFVPFFGVPASTTPALASLALRTGASVIPVFSVPQPDGVYRITYEPAVPLPETASAEAAVVELTAACTAIIERWVRAYPHLWLWMHRRWKTRPPLAEAA